MSDAQTKCPQTKCQRCDLVYPESEPACPRCRRIRQTNIAIATTMIMLVLLAVVGWIGMQLLFM